VKTGGAEWIDGNKNPSERVSSSIGMQSGLRAMQHATLQIWLPLPLAALTLYESLAAALQLCPTVCGAASATGAERAQAPQSE